MSGPRPRKRVKRSVEQSEKEKVAERASKKRGKARNPKGASEKCTTIRKPRKNSKTGRLALLMQMPLDVFYEIARNLTPGDLINLARLTKSWRKLLMTKASKPIWHAARDNVGLPDCPDDLSEPEYADLLYSRGCMICASPLAKSIYFAFRLRLCKYCFRGNSQTGVRLIRKYAPELCRDADYTIYKLSPYHFEYIYASTEEELRLQIADGWIWFMEDEFVRVLDKYTRLNGKKKKEYVKRRTEYAAKVNKHARLVDIWIDEEKKRKKDEKKAIGIRRRDKIFARLRELGYNDEDFIIYECRWSQLTEVPRELTERVWKRIKPELVQLIETERERYISSSAFIEDSEDQISGNEQDEGTDDSEGSDLSSATE